MTQFPPAGSWTMNAFGGTAPSNSFVDVAAGTTMLPSKDLPGTAVTAGAVCCGQVAEPLWLAVHEAAVCAGCWARAADRNKKIGATKTTERFNDTFGTSLTLVGSRRAYQNAGAMLSIEEASRTRT